MEIYASSTSPTFDIYPPCNICYSIKFTPLLQCFNKSNMANSGLNIFWECNSKSQSQDLIFCENIRIILWSTFLFILSLLCEKKNSSCFLPETSQLTFYPPKQWKGGTGWAGILWKWNFPEKQNEPIAGPRKAWDRFLPLEGLNQASNSPQVTGSKNM